MSARRHPPAIRIALLRPRAKRRRIRRQRTKRLGRLLLACLILWGLVVGFYIAWAWTFDLQMVGQIPESSLVLDRHGAVAAGTGAEQPGRVILSHET